MPSRSREPQPPFRCVHRPLCSHYHCRVIDGVCELVAEALGVLKTVRFQPATALTPETVATITEQVFIQVLRGLALIGLIERNDVRGILARENSGCYLDTALRVAAHNRARPHRLLYPSARPVDVQFVEHCCRL
jgi:hypothetical protein